MNAELCQSSTFTSYSLTERLLAATGAAVTTFQSTWRNHAEQVAEAGTYNLMADIDAHTLRDIGAPNWLIAQATERKDSHQLHLIELYRS